LPALEALGALLPVPVLAALLLPPPQPMLAMLNATTAMARIFFMKNPLKVWKNPRGEGEGWFDTVRGPSDRESAVSAGKRILRLKRIRCKPL
jgi:hypothetical protein